VLCKIIEAPQTININCAIERLKDLGALDPQQVRVIICGKMWERCLQAVEQEDGGSITSAAVSKLKQFRSPDVACVLLKRLKLEVNDVTQGVNV